MRRPFWQITGRVTAGVVAVALAVCALWFSGESTSDDEGMWSRDTPPATTTSAAPASSPTPEQVIALARSPLGAQVRGVVDTITDRASVPPVTIGQRAVGLDGPIGADVQGITATGTLSPGAQLQKNFSTLSWPDPLGDAAHKVLVVGGLVICGTWVLMIGSWVMQAVRR